MEVFDDYILRKIHEVSEYNTFVSLIKTSKRFYNNHKDLIPIKRKESLKLITTYGVGCMKENYYVLPNGMKEGLYEVFYKNGNVFKRCHYIDDKYTGLYEVFYEDGNVSERCNYINGNIEGLCEYFYANGSICVTCNYTNNNIEGLYEEFYEDGSLKALKEYKNGTVIKCKVHINTLFRIRPLTVKDSQTVYLVDLNENMCHRFTSITSAAEMLNISKDVVEKRCKSSKIKHREYWINERDISYVNFNGNIIDYINIIKASLLINISVHDIKILCKTKQSLDGYRFCMY